MTVEHFGRAYLAYAESVASYPRFSYEAICREPRPVVSELCRVLGASYDDTFLDRFDQYTRCTGDTSLSVPSRGRAGAGIRSLPDSENADAYLRARSHPDCQEADRILGYDVLPPDEDVQVARRLLDARDRCIVGLTAKLEAAAVDLRVQQAGVEAAQRRQGELEVQVQAEVERARAAVEKTQQELADAWDTIRTQGAELARLRQGSLTTFMAAWSRRRTGAVRKRLGR